jgi:putative flippase GtrA
MRGSGFSRGPRKVCNSQFVLFCAASFLLHTRMKQVISEDHVQPRRALQSRLFWFMAGAGLNYLLIATPFRWLQTHTQLPILAIAACSLGVSASFFFLWNYFINFRTQARKRDALPRYLGAVACMWVLSSLTLTLLKHADWHMSFSLARFSLDLDVVATQFFLAGLKFFLYHKWVFPVPKEPPVVPSEATNL